MDLAVEAEEEVVVGVVPGVHQAVLRVVADPGVLLLVFPVGLVVRVADLLERTDRPLSPMVLVRVLVLASWGDLAWVGSSDLPSVDIAGGAVVTMDWVLLVGTVLGIGWKILLC